MSKSTKISVANSLLLIFYSVDCTVVRHLTDFQVNIKIVADGGMSFEEFIQDHSTQTYIIVIMGKVPEKCPSSCFKLVVERKKNCYFQEIT